MLQDLSSRFQQYLSTVVLTGDVYFGLAAPPFSPKTAVETIDRCPNFKATVAAPRSENLLFIGNLSPEYCDSNLRDLCEVYGPVVRSFVVRNDSTGTSKGYGFVEYLSASDATIAKASLASKQLNGRSIRVDWAASDVLSIDAIHSRTLFIDRLPRSFADGELLRKCCQIDNTDLDFCQVRATVALHSGRYRVT